MSTLSRGLGQTVGTIISMINLSRFCKSVVTRILNYVRNGMDKCEVRRMEAYRMEI